MTSGALQPPSRTVFLGLAERVGTALDLGHPGLLKWNVLGLKITYPSAIFPLSLQGVPIGLGVDTRKLSEGIRIFFVDDKGTDVGNIQLSTAPASPNGPTAFLANKEQGESAVMPHPEYGVAVIFFDINGAILIPRPGRYRVEEETQGGRSIIGELQFAPFEVPPLTPARIAAIRSNPKASKAVRWSYLCNDCRTGIKAYAGLDRLSGLESEGYRWYADLDSEFRCSCGRHLVDLQYIRRNLHVALGHRIDVDGEPARFSPLYERSTLESLRNAFSNLLSGNTPEEVVHQFIRENPVLLHRFSATQLYSKPSILTDYKADFVALGPNGELTLIELERPSLRLGLKGGGRSAPLQHAHDQVISWLAVCDNHRQAFLSSLSIPSESVTSIRGVVIAGREESCPPAILRHVKFGFQGRVSLLTYDDLLVGLDTLIRTFVEL